VQHGASQLGIQIALEGMSIPSPARTKSQPSRRKRKRHIYIERKERSAIESKRDEKVKLRE